MKKSSTQYAFGMLFVESMGNFQVKQLHHLNDPSFNLGSPFMGKISAPGIQTSPLI